MKLVPVNDNVIVELPEVDKEVKSASGLILARDNGQSKPDRAIVVACGEGRVTMGGDIIPMKVQAGDEIIFNRFAGTEINADDKRFLIIKESDILAKIK